MPLEPEIGKLIHSEELVAITHKVVAHYSHVVPKSEVEDLAMHVIEQFLQQEAKITQNFSGKSKPSTYCYAVLNRMCCGLIRRELPRWKRQNNEEINDSDCRTSSNETANAFVIQDEVKYLEKIFVLLDDKSKFIVFFAFYSQLSYKEIHLVSYASEENLKQVMSLLKTDITLSKGELFMVLAELASLVEGKATKADAVRMWLNKVQLDIIGKLNGRWGRANYGKETFRTLFEILYEKQK